MLSPWPEVDEILLVEDIVSFFICHWGASHELQYARVLVRRRFVGFHKPLSCMDKSSYACQLSEHLRGIRSAYSTRRTSARCL